MEIINSFFHFFTDKTRALSSKAIISIVVIVLIILIDNTLSFSFYYNNDKKIEQVLSINKTLSNPTLELEEKTYLIQLRQEIISRKTWKDKVWDFMSNMNFTSTDSKISFEDKLEDQTKINQRSYFWHFISSSWPILFMMLIFPIVGVLDQKTSLGQTILILFFLEPLLYGIAWIFAKIFSYIPVILNNPIYNYVLNSIIWLGLALFVGLIEKKSKNKKL